MTCIMARQSTPDFVHGYEEARYLMEEDTACGLLEEPKFIRWKLFDISSVLSSSTRELDERVLWVKGK